MKEKIKKIKEMLEELESCSSDEESQEFSKNYNAFELPAIISSVIDFLHPVLKPYEIAVYWYLFNNSIIKTGEQFVRASTRGMSGIAKSASGQSNTISYKAIQDSLNSLKEIGAISIAGDTNRDGTLYKVAIPDEISICRAMMVEKSKIVETPVDTKKELDFYNISDNRIKIFERDNFKCHYCGKLLTRFSATLDHIQPVSRGGDNSYDNLVTACLHCNSERGNKPVMDFITSKNGE
jgi:hypothetical protein